MQKDCTLTDAEERQRLIQAASTAWIGILMARSPTNVPPALLEAADAFIAARDDQLEKYAAAGVNRIAAIPSAARAYIPDAYTGQRASSHPRF